MIIELNGNREDKPLCHVALVAKFLVLNNNCAPANMAGITKKIDMYDFPLHDCTPHRNQTKQ